MGELADGQGAAFLLQALQALQAQVGGSTYALRAPQCDRNFGSSVRYY